MDINLNIELPEKISEARTVFKKELNKSNIIITPNHGKKIILNNILDVNENLGILLGLHISDGLSSRKARSYVTMKFTNTDMTIISSFLKSLEWSLGLKRNNLDYIANYNPAFIKNYEEIGNKWRNELNLEREFRYAIQKKLVKFKLNVILYSVAFRHVLDYLSSRSIEFMKQKEFTIGFLKAVIAAEGNIYLRNRSVKEIFIAQHNDEKRALFERFLRRLKIDYKVKIAENRSGIRIYGYNNLIRVRKYALCSLCSRKNNSFEKGFKKLRKYYKIGRKNWTRKKILQLLFKKSMTASEIANELEMSYYTIWDYLQGRRPGVNNKVKKYKNIKINGHYSNVWRLKNG